MRNRIVDERISQAWLEAAKDLAIRVVAPIHLRTPAGEEVGFEAHILDFGGSRRTVVGVIGDESHWGNVRCRLGYYWSSLSPSYRTYKREYFIDTLNDWQWFGEPALQPHWYTGKPWA